MTTQEMLAALRLPFHPSEIDWRIGSCGKKKDGSWWATALAYRDARADQDRLDSVMGPENWRVEFREWSVGTPGVLCGLSLRLDGEWITKWDGAEQSDTEPMKGGLSDALKRAAVQWGIGRYLYALPKTYADIRDDGVLSAELKIKQGGKVVDSAWVKWNPPTLPGWAIPEGAPTARTPLHVDTPHPAPRPEAKKPEASGSKVRGPVPPCPTCDGPMWDNRDKKASGEFKPKSPDFTCKDKECKTEKGFRSGAWEAKAKAPTPRPEDFDQVPEALEAMMDDDSGGLPF